MNHSWKLVLSEGSPWWYYCTRVKCQKPMTLETLTERCQAGAQRWGQQPPPSIYGHRQATMLN